MLIAALCAAVGMQASYARVHTGMQTEDIKQTLTPALSQLTSAAPSALKNSVSETVNWFNQQGFVDKRTLKDLEAKLKTLRKLNLQTPSKQQQDFDTQMNGVLGMIDGLKSKLRWSWV